MDIPFDPFHAPKTTPVAEMQVRDQAAIEGLVTAVRLRDLRGGHALEATLTDTTGSVLLLFLGRTAVAGIEPGRTLTAAGTLGRHEGDKVILNPYLWLHEVAAAPTCEKQVALAA